MALSETQERWALVISAVVFMIALLLFRFSYDLTLPAKVPRPEPVQETTATTSRKIAASERSYNDFIVKDARSFGLRHAPELDRMSRAFPYELDDEAKSLAPGETLRAGDISLKALKASVPRSSKKHLVLEIANKTGKHLAYRIKTSLSVNSKLCRGTRSIPHNALAIAPRETTRRSECIYRPGMEVKIETIEIMEIPELGFLYLSASEPEKLGLSPRTSAGHKTPLRSFKCDLISSVLIGQGIAKGEITWRDMADFYSRHRCVTYQFPIGYKAFTRDDERSLPASGSN